MKAWVRNSSRRARSCQETGSAAALMTAEASLEGRRGAGTDDLTRLASDVAQAVWKLTREIISLTGTEHPRRAAHGELDAPADHDPGFFTTMRKHLFTGCGSGRIALVEHRKLPCRPLG